MPFAANAVPRSYPIAGFGVGAGVYTWDLARVETAFRAMEDVNRSAGYDIAQPASIPLRGMLLWTLTMRVHRAIDVACQVGRSEALGNHIGMTGGLVSHRFVLTATERFCPFIGLGGGWYAYSFTRPYGAASPADPSGGYYVLDQLVLRGGGGYWTGAGGFTVRLGEHGALDVFAQRVGMSKQTSSYQGTDVSVDLSGTLVGARFTLFN